ncbi:MAG: hypothetical protein C5B52_11605 [Bacteroidetes bacterium]|nr:MAG: hypothetical protein C5B52_11605 [Bacteroidota bacterium]
MKLSILTRNLGLLSAVIILFSCQKELSFTESSGPQTQSPPVLDTLASTYFHCKIDGAKKNFTGSLKALSTRPGGTQYSINISAKLNEDPNDAEGINIILNDISPIAVGTYGDIQQGSVISALVYHPATGTTTYGSGLFPNPELPFTCKIIAVDDNMIKGTFEGDVYLNGTGSQKIRITEGNFVAPF